MALTEKKRRYAVSRLAGMSKKEAAIAAGCPEKTASQAASRYEKDPDVKAAMSRTAVAQQNQKPAAPKIDPDVYVPETSEDALDFFRLMMNDQAAEPRLRLDAAKALASFTIPKPGDKGKKEQVQEKAQAVGEGRFGLRKAGQLRAVK